MNIVELTTEISLWGLVKHVYSWLSNLQRASADRKTESKDALSFVIIAARRTQTYLRQLHETGTRDYSIEADLSAEWTALSFKLRELGLDKLAKRCDIKGKYWSNPAEENEGFFKKADIGLGRMESLARQLYQSIDN